MSEERRKRQQERLQQAEPKAGLRKLLIAVVIVAAFGAAAYLGLRKRTSRLDAFAQCIASRGAKMYGLYWCPHCEDQKEIFGSAFQYVPYIECGIKGQARGEVEGCKQAGVKNFPTWEFAGGERKEGTLSLQALSDRTGCSLP